MQQNSNFMALHVTALSRPLTPRPWSIPSETNLIQSKLDVVVIGIGTLFPQ